MKKLTSKLTSLLASAALSVTLLLSGCSNAADNESKAETKTVTAEANNSAQNAKKAETKETKKQITAEKILAMVPPFSGKPYVTINNNQPYFNESDKTTKAFETYSDLDNLGRPGVAYACVGVEIMPTEKRGKIGNIKPPGWHTARYDDVIKDKYLYNRCHLIAFMLAGENDNPKNLITGTRYFNTEAMLPFEEKVQKYVKKTKHHVLYRVTPIYDGNNLVASGVLMEAESVEDNQILFCVYCYNVQPKIGINYKTGESWKE